MADFRPRLSAYHEKYIPIIRDMSAQELDSIFFKNDKLISVEKSKRSLEEKNGQVIHGYEGNACLTSKEDAIKFFEVDEKEYEVERYVGNSWSTTNGEGTRYMNYQVKLFLKKRADVKLNKFIKELKKKVDKAARKVKVREKKGKGDALATGTDFHVGAKVKDLLVTADYDISILIKYLEEAAYLINEKGCKNVSVALLGDYVESITGLNHLSVWQEMGYGQFGANAIILVSEILRDHFLSKINNLRVIYMVSGNHDRFSANKQVDVYRGAADLVAYNIRRDFPNIEVKYHPVLLNPVVDNIQYILSHGDFRIATRDMNATILKHGNKDLFNCILLGHKHTRESKKGLNKTSMIYQEQKITHLDEVNSRSIFCPSFFTGNFFSESLGFTSSSGFTITENNGKGKINHQDFCL